MHSPTMHQRQNIALANKITHYNLQNNALAFKQCTHLNSSHFDDEEADSCAANHRNYLDNEWNDTYSHSAIDETAATVDTVGGTRAAQAAVGRPGMVVELLPHICLLYHAA